MSTSAAEAYLRKKEWSMGNGQCPECCATGPAWLLLGGWGNEIGHKRNCDLAQGLEDLGYFVVWEMPCARKNGMFSPVDWEHASTKALVEVIERAHPKALPRCIARDVLHRADPDDLEWQDLQLVVRKYEGKE